MANNSSNPLDLVRRIQQSTAEHKSQSSQTPKTSGVEALMLQTKKPDAPIVPEYKAWTDAFGNVNITNTRSGQTERYSSQFTWGDRQPGTIQKDSFGQDLGQSVTGALARQGANYRSAAATLGLGVMGLLKGKDYQPEVGSTLWRWQEGAEAATKAADLISQDSKEGRGAAGRLAMDLASGAVDLAGDQLLNLAVPGSGMAAMATRVFGGESEQARQEGKNIGQQFLAGAKAAAIEWATEKVAGIGGRKGVKPGWIDGALDNAVDRFVARGGNAILGKMAVAFGSEAAEEILSGVLNPLADRMLKLDPDAKIDWGETLYEGLIGGILGLFGGANEGIKYTREQAAAILQQNVEKAVDEKIAQQAAGEQIPSGNIQTPPTQQNAPTGNPNALNSGAPSVEASEPSKTQPVGKKRGRGIAREAYEADVLAQQAARESEGVDVSPDERERTSRNQKEYSYLYGPNEDVEDYFSRLGKLEELSHGSATLDIDGDMEIGRIIEGKGEWAEYSARERADYLNERFPNREFYVSEGRVVEAARGHTENLRSDLTRSIDEGDRNGVNLGEVTLADFGDKVLKAKKNGSVYLVDKADANKPKLSTRSESEAPRSSRNYDNRYTQEEIAWQEQESQRRKEQQIARRRAENERKGIVRTHPVAALNETGDATTAQFVGMIQDLHKEGRHDAAEELRQKGVELGILKGESKSDTIKEEKPTDAELREYQKDSLREWPESDGVDVEITDEDVQKLREESKNGKQQKPGGRSFAEQNERALEKTFDTRKPNERDSGESGGNGQASEESSGGALGGDEAGGLRPDAIPGQSGGDRSRVRSGEKANLRRSRIANSLKSIGKRLKCNVRETSPVGKPYNRAYEAIERFTRGGYSLVFAETNRVTSLSAGSTSEKNKTCVVFTKLGRFVIPEKLVLSCAGHEIAHAAILDYSARTGNESAATEIYEDIKKKIPTQAARATLTEDAAKSFIEKGYAKRYWGLDLTADEVLQLLLDDAEKADVFFNETISYLVDGSLQLSEGLNADFLQKAAEEVMQKRFGLGENFFDFVPPANGSETANLSRDFGSVLEDIINSNIPGLNKVFGQSGNNKQSPSDSESFGQNNPGEEAFSELSLDEREDRAKYPDEQQYKEERYNDKHGFDSAKGWQEQQKADAEAEARAEAPIDRRKTYGNRLENIDAATERIRRAAGGDAAAAVPDSAKDFLGRSFDGARMSVSKLAEDFSNAFSAEDDGKSLRELAESLPKRIRKSKTLQTLLGDAVDGNVAKAAAAMVDAETEVDFQNAASDLAEMMAKEIEELPKTLAALDAWQKKVEKRGKFANFLSSDKTLGRLASVFFGYQRDTVNILQGLDGFDKYGGGPGYELAKAIIDGNHKSMMYLGNALDTVLTAQDAFEKAGGAEKTVELSFIKNKQHETHTITLAEAIDMLKNIKTMQQSKLSPYRDVYYNFANDRIKLTSREQFDAVMEALDKAVLQDKTAKAYFDALTNGYAIFKDPAKGAVKNASGRTVDMYDEDYYPLLYGEDRKASGEHGFDFGLDETSFTQRRTQYEGGSVQITDPAKRFDAYAHTAAKLIGRAEVGAAMERLNRGGVTPSITEIVEERYGKGHTDVIEQFIKDTSNFREDGEAASSILRQMRLNIQGGALFGNFGSMLKQFPSVFNAAGILDMDSIMHGVTTQLTNKEARERAGSIGSIKTRHQGNLDPSVAETLGENSGFKKATEKLKILKLAREGFEIVDSAAIRSIYLASEYQVEVKDNISRDSPEFEEAVMSYFVPAFMQTQPQFDKTLRPYVQTSENELIRMFGMFKTQPLRNLNTMIRTVSELNAVKENYGKNSEEYKATEKQLRTTVAGQASASLMFGALGALAKLLYHRNKDLEDDEGKLDGGKLMARILMNAAEAAGGSVIFGDAAVQLAIDMASGGNTKEFYGLNAGAVSSVADALDAINTFAQKPTLYNVKKTAGYIATLFGIPLNNAYAVLNSAIMYTKDIAGDNEGNYDDILKAIDAEIKAEKKAEEKAQKEAEKEAAKAEQVSGYLKKPFEALKESGMEAKESKALLEDIDTDDNNSIKQAELWAWYEANPDKESMAILMWNAYGWKTSWSDYKAKHKK